MPITKKHVINYNSIKYSLSEGQYFMLTKSTVPAKDVLIYSELARMKGLVGKLLFEFNGRSYKRTDLGSDLLRAYKQREKARVEVK